MKILMIEKYVENAHQETIKVPLFVIKILRKLLPGSGKSLLSMQLMDLEEIISAATQDKPLQKILYVTEQDIAKKLVLSLRG